MADFQRGAEAGESCQKCRENEDSTSVRHEEHFDPESGHFLAEAAHLTGSAAQRKGYLVPLNLYCPSLWALPVSHPQAACLPDLPCL